MSIELDIRQNFFISPRELNALVTTAPHRYKVHTIRKRNNRGTRLIAQPKAEIKTLQRFVLGKYLADMPVHSAASAYIKGKSIKDHATPHVNNKYLLKLDFENFFNSIVCEDFRLFLLTSQKFDAADIWLLSNLFFWKPKDNDQMVLSIGAPSSPHISNILMYDFDLQLSKYCGNSNITYTRYADDIALSTNEPKALDAALNFVSSLCISLPTPKLKINENKTIFTSKKWNRSLTGLTLSNENGVSLGREKKRILRATAYNYSVGKLDDNQVPILRGHLAFAFSVEPKFVDKIKEMIGQELFKQLMHF